MRARRTRSPGSSHRPRMGASPPWNRDDFWHARFLLLRGFHELWLDEASSCQDGSRTGLSEDRLHFKLLPGLDRQIGSRRPYFIIDEQLEGDRILDSPRPSPGFAIHARQRHAAFPRQTASVPSEKHGIAKPDIQFDIDGCDSAGSGSGQFGSRDSGFCGSCCGSSRGCFNVWYHSGHCRVFSNFHK